MGEGDLSGYFYDKFTVGEGKGPCRMFVRSSLRALNRFNNADAVYIKLPVFTLTKQQDTCGSSLHDDIV